MAAQLFDPAQGPESHIYHITKAQLQSALLSQLSLQFSPCSSQWGIFYKPQRGGGAAAPFL